MWGSWKLTWPCQCWKTKCKSNCPTYYNRDLLPDMHLPLSLWWPLAQALFCLWHSAQLQTGRCPMAYWSQPRKDCPVMSAHVCLRTRSWQARHCEPAPTEDLHSYNLDSLRPCTVHRATQNTSGVGGCVRHGSIASTQGCIQICNMKLRFTYNFNFLSLFHPKFNDSNLTKQN